MRQFWIFFAAGTGGDGLANLLERCHGMHDWAPEPLIWGQRGPMTPVWRVHRIVDGAVKFWAPAPDVEACFRLGKRFDSNSNCLKNSYLEAVQAEKNIVVASHDVTLRHLDSSDCLDIFSRGQVKILLDSRDYFRCHQQHIKKCLVSTTLQEFEDLAAVKKTIYTNYQTTDRSRFDHVVWIEDLGSVESLQEFVQRLGLDVETSVIEQYLTVKSGDWPAVRPTGQSVPAYRSRVENHMIFYESVDQ